MTEHARDDRAARMSRRHLLVVGGAGATALWLGAGRGVADAAPLRPGLHRAAWLQVADPATATVLGGRPVGLRLVEVADLPVAASLPGLRDHDAAFLLRFAGPPGLPSGVHRMTHPDVGTVDLFLASTGGAGSAHLYEAIVDRTVRVADVDDDGAPEPVRVPSARAAPPRSAEAVAGAPAAARAPAAVRRAPRVRRLRARRAASRRAARAVVTLADAGAVVTVHGVLHAGERVVGRCSVPVRRGQPVTLRLPVRRALRSGRYVLALVLVERDGRVTQVRRRVRL